MEVKSDVPAPRTLVYKTGWMLAGMGGRLSLQLIAFILLARTLGASAFGTFSAALAMASLLAPYVELGAYSLGVRDVTSGVPPAKALGASLLLAFVALVPGTLALASLNLLIGKPASWSLVGALAAAVFVGGRTMTTFRSLTVARGELRKQAVMEWISGIAQIGAVAVFVWARGGVEMWAALYAGQSLLVGTIALAWLISEYGVPRATWAELKRRASDGFHFAMALSAQNAYAEVDKTILVKQADALQAGLYSAAQRVVAVAFLPLMAFIGTVYPQFFSAGRAGLSASRRIAWRMLPVVAGYGAVAGAAMWIGAPLVADLLGPGFGEAQRAVRSLAPIILIQGCTYPFADALSGSGHQRTRTAAQLGVLTISVGLNLWLDGRHGWRGAAIAALVSQSLNLGFLIVASPRVSTWMAARGARARNVESLDRGS